MNCYISLIVSSLMLLGGNEASESSQQEPGAPFVVVMDFKCEGKVSANYTYISAGTFSSNGIKINSEFQARTLIQDSPRIVIPLVTLSSTFLDAGRNELVEILMLATAGPMEGQFVFLRTYELKSDYLKRFSSPLGNAVNPIWNPEIFVLDKLEQRYFTSVDGFHPIAKKEAKTICSGSAYLAA